MARKTLGFRIFGMTVLSNKNQEGLVAGVCCFSKLSTISVDEEKKSLVKAWNNSFWKWSWLTGPSIHGAQQKSRRCFPKESSVLSKESTILFKRSDDAKRKQSIYSQISLNCYAVGGRNTGPKHSKIIVFPLGFREVFSLLPSLSLRIHLEQHCRVWRIPKRSLLFRWESIPLWGFL